MTSTTLDPTRAGSGSPWTTILRTETRLLAREPGALFWVLAFPTLLLVILGAIPSFRKPDADLGGLRVVDLYVPISLLLSMILASIQVMPGILVGYRERGVLRRLAVTPARPSSLLTVQLALNAAACLAGGVLVVLVGRLAYDVPVPPQLVGFVLAYLLALVSVMTVGAVLTALAPSVKAATAIGTIVVFPMMFTAGVWLPVNTMPDLLRRIVEATPMGAGAQAMNQALAGEFPSWTHLGVMAAWSVALVMVAARYFRWE
jgi:ABC-2 type transport system permease protein